MLAVNISTTDKETNSSGAYTTKSGRQNIDQPSQTFVDPYSPYFLHSSDHPGAVLISTPLNGDNYPTWLRAFRNALRAKNKLCIVDGSLSKPAVDSSDLQAWEKCNSMVISWLFNSITSELQNNIAYADTACEIWIDLEERFSQRSAPRIHQLKWTLSLLQQENLSVAIYYTIMFEIWDELGAYFSIPQCTYGILQEKENQKVHQFLISLNDVFNTIHSKILSMEPLPNLSKVYAMVVREEKQHMLRSTVKRIVEAAAFNVNATSISSHTSNRSKE